MLSGCSSACTASLLSLEVGDICVCVVPGFSRACDLPFPGIGIFDSSFWPSLQLSCVALFASFLVLRRMLDVPQQLCQPTKSWALCVGWVSLACGLDSPEIGDVPLHP
jgi:hypothetical protein